MAYRNLTLLGVCLILFSILAPAATAVRTAGESGQFKLLVQPTNSTGPSPNDYQCESDRAPDYYGIGVRLVCNISTPEPNPMDP